MYDIFSSATDSGVIADVSTVAVAARLVEDKVGRLAADLEAFAGHARRSTVNTDDVKLLARNNSKLSEHLQSFAAARSEIQAAKRANDKAKRKQ